jgi:c-di-GMP-binding flagellar brake protein YcgR
MRRETHTRRQPEVGETLIVARVGDDTGRDQTLPVEVKTVRRRGVEVICNQSSSHAPRLTQWSDCVVDVSFVRPDGLYTFHATVRLRRSRQGAPALFLEGDPSARVVQRRRLYRLPLTLRTRVWPNIAGARLIGNTPSIPSLIVNLSAGGALVSVTERASAGQIVALDVPHGVEGAPSPVAASVISCESSGVSGGLSKLERYEWRVQFDNGSTVILDDTTREEIIQYIFAQQRMMLSVRKLMMPSGSATPTRKKRTRILTAFADWLRAPSK